MALKITKAQVWAGTIQDRPGGLAEILDPLAEAGANLECVIGRRMQAGPAIAPEGGGEISGGQSSGGEGVVFLTPIKGKKVQNAATAAGLKPSSIATLRVEGPNKAGIGAKMARALGDASVNMRGVSAAVMGNKFVAYLGFDSADDASNAAKALKKV